MAAFIFILLFHCISMLRNRLLLLTDTANRFPKIQ